MSIDNTLRIVNKAQLATIFGKSLVTIDSWIRNGMPFVHKGDKSTEWKFDTSAVQKWREEQIYSSALGNVENAGIEELRKRKLVVEIGLLENELQKNRQEVVSIAEAEQALTHSYLTIKQRLRTIPERLASQLAAESDEQVCGELLLNEIDDILLELSQLDFDGTKPQ